jgi:hypothetical protein
VSELPRSPDVSHDPQTVTDTRQLDMKPASGPLRKPAALPPCPKYSLTQLLVHFTFARILLLLGSLVTPFKGWLSWNLLLGRSLWQLARDLERLIVRLLGWLIAPPRHPWLRSLGGGVLHLRRWHLAAGG